MFLVKVMSQLLDSINPYLFFGVIQLFVGALENLTFVHQGFRELHEPRFFFFCTHVFNPFPMVDVVYLVSSWQGFCWLLGHFGLDVEGDLFSNFDFFLCFFY